MGHNARSHRARAAFNDYLALASKGEATLERMAALYRERADRGEWVPTDSISTLKKWSMYHGWQEKVRAIQENVQKRLMDLEAEHRARILREARECSRLGMHILRRGLELAHEMEEQIGLRRTETVMTTKEYDLMGDRPVLKQERTAKAVTPGILEIASLGSELWNRGQLVERQLTGVAPETQVGTTVNVAVVHVDGKPLNEMTTDEIRAEIERRERRLGIKVLPE